MKYMSDITKSSYSLGYFYQNQAIHMKGGNIKCTDFSYPCYFYSMAYNSSCFVNIRDYGLSYIEYKLPFELIELKLEKLHS